jgi:enoyl-CoA hydratase
VTSSECLRIETGDDGIVLVTLNRPEALNSANEELHGAIAAVWPELAAIEGAKAIVITGAGRAFSAGGDLPLLRRMVDDLDLRAKIMTEAATLVRAMTSFALPIVAAVNGAAVGLGCSLASLSDLVVMEEQAYFADPHVALGLVAGDGGAITWPFNMGLQRAKEWILLGGQISSAQALDWGLANRVVPAGQALTEARALATRLAKLPPQALAETRRVLNQPLAARVAEALDDVLSAETRSFEEPAFQRNLERMLARQSN